MTSRLKRKLADLGVDISSKKANENFCLIGTPLPSLDKRDANEYVPLWKQDVRDEKGRRRLHGAFTGGFSAGYFNTVGSKEGWAPSTFVSSRNDRAKKQVARPEDYMDEEDLQELKESRKLVSNVDAMDLTGKEAEQARQTGEGLESDPMRGALLAALLPPPKDSAGARVLMKMGWKLGQGVGPRISYRQRKLEDMRAATNKPLTLADVVITEEEEEAAKHTYPRRDTPVLVYERKTNAHGLGYKSGLGLNDSLGRSKPQSETGPNISSGFGLGALNEADEDDIDVYESGYNSGKARVAFDLTEHDDDTNTITLSQKQPKVEKQASRHPTVNAKFSSGIPVLAGFAIDDEPVAPDTWFTVPEVPEGWKPNPKRVWESDPNKENVQAQAEKLKEPMTYHKWKTGMSSDERGSLLGETPIPAAPRSVFEYMSQKDRERIQNIAAGLPAEPQPAGPIDIRIPHTDSHVAKAALQGFQPFSSDAVKHERYTAYLFSQADPSAPTPAPLTPLPDQRNEEFNKELEDYAKAAAIFKPMTGLMAGRFTSAAIVEHGPKIREGLHTPSAEELEKYEEEKKRLEEKLTPQQNAAKLGMYGPLTREVRPWQPAKLLCKRFGVKEPEIQLDTDLGAGSSVDAPAEPSWQEQAGIPVPTEDATAASTKRDLNHIGMGEDESQGVDTLTYERPSMDIFKAIFASDEESGDEDVKEEDEEDEAEKNDVVAKFFPEQPESSGTKGDEGPVDLSTFKPTFIPRDRKSKSSKDKDKDKDREKKEKEKNGDTKKEKKDKDKKKKDKKSLVSFEVDEGGGGLSFSSKPGKRKDKGKDKDNKDKDKERPKKKRREEKQEEGEDEMMWEPSSQPQRSSAPNTTVTDGPGVNKTSDIAHQQQQQPPPPPPVTGNLDGHDPDGAPANKGRKRAIDFM